LFEWCQREEEFVIGDFEERSNVGGKVERVLLEERLMEMLIGRVVCTVG